MRSRVVREFPYQEVDLSPYKRKLSEDSEYVKREMRRLVRPYITWTEGGPVKSGDVAVCRLKSAEPKYDREQITVTVGLGMLPAFLETALLGKRAGDFFEIQENGPAVFVTVLEVRNKNVPEPADSMVRDLEIAGVDTMEAYRSHLLLEQKEADFRENGYEAAEHLISELILRSEILIREEDWQVFVDRELERVRRIAKSEGLTLEAMTEKEFAGRAPVKSYDGLVALVQKNAWRECALSLLGRAMAERDGHPIDLGEEEGCRKAQGYFYETIETHIKSVIYEEEGKCGAFIRMPSDDVAGDAKRRVPIPMKEG